MILRKKILPKRIIDKELSFNTFINEQIKKKKLIIILMKNYLSISDNTRYKATKKYFKDNVILVDRDGVLNEKNKFHFYVRNLNELKINNSFIKSFGKILRKKSFLYYKSSWNFNRRFI